MKRIRTAAWLLLLLLLLPQPVGAVTRTRGAFTKAVYVFPYGTEGVFYLSLFSEAESTWTVESDEGTVLFRDTFRATDRDYPVRFPVTEALPRRTTLHLLADGEPLGEAQLFCDQFPNDGVRRVARGNRKVALTFDSAISAGYTPEILDVLDKYGVKATFFVIGQFVESNPALAAHIVARGHLLASHSYTHMEMRTASGEQAFDNIRRAEEVIRAVSGAERILYRPPSGTSYFRDRAIARGMGAEVILWTVDSGDGFQTRSKEQILEQIQKGMRPGSILLLHVYGGFTVGLLDVVLPEYMGQGYEFVTVPELLLPADDAYIDLYGVQRPLMHRDLDRETLSLLKIDGTRAEEPTLEPLAGEKDSTLPDTALPKGLWRARVTNKNGWAFLVWGRDGRGERELLVSGSGVYAGTVPLLGQGPYGFEVESGGSWTIQPEPLIRTEDTAFQGHGDSVTDLFVPAGSTYRLRHQGEGDFLVWLYTTAGETLLLHGLGPCEAEAQLTVPADSLAFFVVRADGDWSLEPAA